MKVPLSWLGEYFVDRLAADEVADRFTLSGIEVEQLQPIGALDPRVVVGEIQAIAALPGTSSARVLTIGADRVRTLVSNLTELELGQRLALALPGATLFQANSPALRDVGAGELYGTPSEGVLASAADLGLGSDASRPLAFPATAPAGSAVAAVLGALPPDARADVVLHLSILPNIARCQSMRGVAREVAAILGKKAKPERQLVALGASQKLTPSIEASDACSSLSVYLIEDVEVRRSPDWLEQRLVLAGMSPINNVVDASNYVMLELGQPTHPYDADKLASLDLGVRRARAGDRLLTLQQAETDEPLELAAGVPLIVSNDEPVAVAGVVGGRPSSIGAGTRRILLESAAFDYVAIRRTQQALRIATEASARFSRGVNPELPPLAAARFLEILQQTSPNARLVAAGERSFGVPKARKIELTQATLDQSLGLHVELDAAADCLRRAGVEVAIDRAGARLEVLAGNARQDLALPCDLVEEIARLSGYDKIPETMPIEPIPEHLPDPGLLAREAVRDGLVRAGLQEIIGYCLTSSEVEARLYAGATAPGPRPVPVPILNPVSADRSVLRTTLLPGLLETAALNLRNASSCRLFEIGPIFLPSGQVLPDERERAALVLAGVSVPPSLHEREPRPVDFFDLKAVLEAALAAGGLWSRLSVEPATLPGYRPGAGASLSLGGRVAGHAGAVHPLALEAFGLSGEAVFAAELELEVLLAGAGARPQFVDFDRLPSIEIDIACILPQSVTAETVRGVARESAGPLLRAVEIFDVFRGPQFGADKLALALRLRLNAGDRTLEMSEALAVRSRVAAALRERLSATIRE